MRVPKSCCQGRKNWVEMTRFKRSRRMSLPAKRADPYDTAASNKKVINSSSEKNLFCSSGKAQGRCCDSIEKRLCYHAEFIKQRYVLFGSEFRSKNFNDTLKRFHLNRCTEIVTQFDCTRSIRSILDRVRKILESWFRKNPICRKKNELNGGRIKPNLFRSVRSALPSLIMFRKKCLHAVADHFTINIQR